LTALANDLRENLIEVPKAVRHKNSATTSAYIQRIAIKRDEFDGEFCKCIKQGRIGRSSIVPSKNETPNSKESPVYMFPSD